MAVFGTFHNKLGNVWAREYIADNGEAFYLRRRNGEQLVFIAVDTLYCTKRVNYNAVVEYHATAQIDACGNECCTVERAGTQLSLSARECRLSGCGLTWQERKKIIDVIKGITG